MKIEFLYFDGCPSYQTADRLLREALAEENQSATIEMIKIETEADAQRWKFAGPPTIRSRAMRRTVAWSVAST